MSDDIYNNVIKTGSEGMTTERVDMSVDIYESADCVGDHELRTETNIQQSPQHTGTYSVRIRSSRAAPVCLVLLCVLLLTAVIVLSVYIHTKSTNYTEERDQLLNKITNLTEEIDGLIIKKTFYQTSFYYMPNETKNWTESRRYCTERGADLIIINNREEQDFVNNMSGDAVVYIGLNDSDVENTWKWVDGSTLTSGFWASREPNGDTRENCVVTVAVPKLPYWPGLVGWLDVECDKAYQWICEKNISQLI
ncbi:CD209 antigen-like protein E [Chanodichthys erythropterus]|uniref:CD209 antigen-like protein E n=1 Tax=Chanodichthys erythropterus TaxID=933992 RepID=UPI00351DF25A